MGRRYQEVEILSGSPESLVVKLYEAAIRHGRAAREHHERGQVGERGRSISRAIEIVAELQHALDHERGGEIAGKLESLYLFVLDRLVEANCSASARALEEAVQILVTLHGAWAEIAKGVPVPVTEAVG